VPVRRTGFDYSRPVDGTTSATDWQGFHPAADLVQLLNPDQGYMQNCNIPPDAMLVGSPLRPDLYPDYIFADRSHHALLSGWTNPRGARAVELLEGDSSVTVEEALAYAMDVQVYEAGRWLELFSRARERFAGAETEGQWGAAADDLAGWDHSLAPDSTGALKYFLWKEQLEASGFPAEQARVISDLRAALGESVPLPELDEAGLRQLWDAFVTAMEKSQASGGGPQVRYGDVFRVGRGDRSWPVGGGGRHGTSTLRNMNYEKKSDGSYWGRSGQTSPQVVVMSNPVRSWTVTPLGQSDRTTSPHYSDQAEKLFSRGLMKPTWWTPAELAVQPKQRVHLPYPRRE
jgi:acyl-homoserine-lactone acylase